MAQWRNGEIIDFERMPIYYRHPIQYSFLPIGDEDDCLASTPEKIERKKNPPRKRGRPTKSVNAAEPKTLVDYFKIRKRRFPEKPKTCCKCTTGCDKAYCACVKASKACQDACGKECRAACLNRGERPKEHTPKKGCGCKQSSCLKKYCKCFASSAVCGPECKCSCV